MTRSIRGAINFVLAATLLGCAHATSQSPVDQAPDNVLTSEQLASGTSENLYDAIAKMRPRWLTSRGPTSVGNGTPTMADVFMNGNMLGTAEYLRDVRLVDVGSVRYWEAGQASARFGMGHPRGVIEITRR